MIQENSLVRCQRCLMDSTDPDIIFTGKGTCNHCDNFFIARKPYTEKNYVESELDRIVNDIKRNGQGKKYDCIVGVSGGVDSTYVCYTAKKLGLRPLAVHVDNGWNSELAVQNITNTLEILGIDLMTEVLDWEEFRSLQLSMLRSSTPDIELPTDHAIRAVLLRTANKENISYLLNGRNFSTEGILPWSWAYSALDFKYLRYIHKSFGGKKLKLYPRLPLLKIFYYVAIKKIKNISILNYVEFNKGSSIKILQQELNWRDYGGKHHESIFTRFLQGYILPRKFEIDKRKAHLSVLILTGQMSRSEALAELKAPHYPIDVLTRDTKFVLKKLKLSEAYFENLMRNPIKSYKDYPNSEFLLVPGKNDFAISVMKLLRKIGILPKGFADNALSKSTTKKTLD